MGKLKKCPFCGSEVKMVIGHSSHFSVRCSNQECMLQKFWFPTIKEATEKWNNRSEGGFRLKAIKQAVLDRNELALKIMLPLIPLYWNTENDVQKTIDCAFEYADAFLKETNPL